MTEIIDRRSAIWIAWKVAAKYRARRILEGLGTLIKVALFVGMCSAAAVVSAYCAFMLMQWLVV